MEPLSPVSTDAFLTCLTNPWCCANHNKTPPIPFKHQDMIWTKPSSCNFPVQPWRCIMVMKEILTLQSKACIDLIIHNHPQSFYSQVHFNMQFNILLEENNMISWKPSHITGLFRFKTRLLYYHLHSFTTCSFVYHRPLTYLPDLQGLKSSGSQP